MLSKLAESLGKGRVDEEVSSFVPQPPKRDFRKIRVDFQCTAKLKDQNLCTRFKPNGLEDCGFFESETKTCYCLTNGVS